MAENLYDYNDRAYAFSSSPLQAGEESDRATIPPLGRPAVPPPPQPEGLTPPPTFDPNVAPQTPSLNTDLFSEGPATAPQNTDMPPQALTAPSYAQSLPPSAGLTPPPVFNAPGLPPTPPPGMPTGAPSGPGLPPGYWSDIATLRSMPQGMVGAYENQLAALGQTPGFQGQGADLIQYLNQDPAFRSRWEQQSSDLSGLPTSLESRSREDIDYLRQLPGTGAFEQAALTSANEKADAYYNSIRQRAQQDAARMGTDVTSGATAYRMNEAEMGRAQDKARAARDLAMWQLGEHRSRLGESRGIEGQLEALARARQTQGRGIDEALEAQRLNRRGGAIQLGQSLDSAQQGRLGMQTGLFREMDALEQQRRAAARGIESDLDQGERQRLMDLLGFLQGGQPSSGPSQIATQQAALAEQQAARRSAEQSNTWNNLGQTAMYYYMMNQLPPPSL